MKFEKNINNNIDQDTIVNHLKNTGYVYQNSEIYNGLANAWDFGPLGSILKNNLKQMWLNHFVFSKNDMYLIDTNIILHPMVWKASGHLKNFADPLIDCKSCQTRYRADKLILTKFSNSTINEQTESNIIEEFIEDNKISCPNCNKLNWTKIRKFNLMFETSIGVVDDQKNKVYLRPETAQGIFINFKNILRSQRVKPPFGVAQIGKAFRNEITPGNFIFRTREFEQMEIEYFCNKEGKDKIFAQYEKDILFFLTKKLNLNTKKLKVYNYPKHELAHYSSKTIDFLYSFPHGETELWGLADRGEYDLTQHQTYSQKNLEYIDEVNKTKFIPCVIEPSVGVERLMYAILLDAYTQETIASDNSIRINLKLVYELAPYKFAVLPLVNKLNPKANQLYNNLILSYPATYDSSGSIGRRYRRQDAIGTPYCVTVDFQTLEDDTVTIRERDSMKQVRVKFDAINHLKLKELF